MAIENSIMTDSDEIRVRGVQCNGYGQIPKIVMLCNSISIEAKGIYAYFCSYTGSGNSAFPSRDRIVHDLNISKDTYYKHFKVLTTLGLITVEQKNGGAAGNGFKHNIYTIEHFPADFLDLCEKDASAAMTSSLVKVRQSGFLASAGYGNIPKSIMISEISVQAKALYAYFCVFSGDNYLATPTADNIVYHLHTSRNSYNKYTKELLTKDYLRKHQTTVGGRFGEVIYYINPNPGTDADKDILPMHKFSDTVVSDTISSDTVKSDTIISDTIKPNANKTNSDKTNSDKTNIYQSISPVPEKVQGISSKPQKMERAINYNRNRQKIWDEIEAEQGLPYSFTEDLSKMTIAVRLLTDWDSRNEAGYYQGPDSEYQFRIYRVFVESLAEMMTDGYPTSVKGAVISYAKVYEKISENFLQVYEDECGVISISLGELPDLVTNSFIRAGRKTTITNVKAYMKSIIWTELQNDELWIQTLADHDTHQAE